MNMTFPSQSDIGVRHLTLLPTLPTFPPQPPTNNRATRWPAPKPIWTVSYVRRGRTLSDDDCEDYILVTAKTCVRDSVNPREVLADGVSINVGGRITDISL